jgi:UDP-N-acetylmuramate dehydrogenase
MMLQNISLKKYNTFNLDYKADFFMPLQSEREAISLIKNRGLINEPVFILGGGSNILFTRDFRGTIIHPEISGIKIVTQKPDYVIVSSGAGVNWDYLVEWTVNKGFGGLENLSLIPGTVGSTPIQNIGAYGVEVKDVIEKTRAISLADGTVREFTKEECRFGYRNSIFKQELKGKYLVTHVLFRLTTNPLLNTIYGSLREETEKLGIVSLNSVRQAVITIRRSKLPDPEVIGNAGSFFKNPVIDSDAARILRNRYRQMPGYEEPAGNIKLAAGWLIDQCGWKGKRIGDAGVYDKQALVLLNYGKATGMEILRLSEVMKRSVIDKFGIELEREVEVL